jgi:O-antigen ligase
MVGDRQSRMLLGFVLLLCLLLGGGTARGLTVDLLLLVAMVCVSAYAIGRHWNTPSSRWCKLIFSLMLCSTLVQLLPVPVSWLAYARPSVFLPFDPSTGRAFEWSSVSLSAPRTILGVITVLCEIAMFVALRRLGREELGRMMLFYSAGVIVNILVVFLNVSSEGCCSLVGPQNHSLAAGLFANQNHLATLFCASIPLAVYGLSVQGMRTFAVLALAAILIALLSLGSRAGILMGFSVLLLSLLVGWRGMRLGRLGASVLVLLVILFGYGAIVRIGVDVPETTLNRQLFALTTLRAIRENLLLGTGYGTFDLVYPHYELLKDIYQPYVNHAHNDFLEIMLEGGIAGAALVIAYIVAVLLQLAKVHGARLQRLSFLSICVVLVHSTVDYPLRTVAMAAAFAFYNALFFAASETSTRPRARRCLDNGNLDDVERETKWNSNA